MKLKELESHLQEVESFDNQKLFLEQYITTPHLASQIAFNIDQQFDDLYGKNVCDLGIGTGMLSIASSFFNPSYILGVDIDTDALSVCQKNIDYFEINSIDLLQADCKQIMVKPGFISNFEGKFDTVIMNPPFGTKNQKITDINNNPDVQANLGIDLQFLKLASILSTGSIYSLHKSVTRNFIKNISKSWGLNMEVVNQLRYNIPKIESRNKRLAKNAPEKDIEVDFIRFTHID